MNFRFDIGDEIFDNNLEFECINMERIGIITERCETKNIYKEGDVGKEYTRKFYKIKTDDGRIEEISIADASAVKNIFFTNNFTTRANGIERRKGYEVMILEGQFTDKIGTIEEIIYPFKDKTKGIYKVKVIGYNPVTDTEDYITTILEEDLKSMKDYVVELCHEHLTSNDIVDVLVEKKRQEGK